ncbi:MAG: GNAT family N-acetyltransferase [Lachnospiraceae bacterium]|nr:GNAT family N-acetyltransferase [Lachnospiraceae bacterium]
MAAITEDVQKGQVGVLVQEDKIIGTGSFVENNITRVYVAPEHQGKGYGTRLVKELEKVIGKRYATVCLEASLPAAHLYETLGYRTVRHERCTVEHDIPFVWEVMEKRLSGTKACGATQDCKESVHPEAGYQYKKAGLEDIDELVPTRITVLRAANRLSAEVDMSQVEQESRAYYEKALADGTHTAYLVYDGERFIGAGGVSIYQVMPTYHNPSGKKAYIMNMYTAPEYRRKGIAMKTLDLLVKEAQERGISQISLEATEAGRPLYEKYGFVKMEDEMELR